MSSHRRVFVTSGTVAVVLAAYTIGFSAQAGDRLVDWRQSRIVFDSERNGNFDIWMMNADGSNQQPLTNWDRGDQFPSSLPDGGKIAFTSWGREGGLRAAIFVMDPDGSNVTRLSRGIGKQDAPMFPGARASGPSWSPDGKKILFNSNGEGNQEDIFVMDADGSNVHRLTRTPGAGRFSSEGYWSPDGNRIVFHSNRNGNEEIYVMSADGSAVKQLTDTPGRMNYTPMWSPDGKRIAFGSIRDRISDNPIEIVEIYVMDTNGSNVRRLTHTTDKGESSSDPKWSPDGKKIAFLSGSGAKITVGDKSRYAQWLESREIYVMDADGSNAQRLTFNSAYDGHPNWQPMRR